MSWSSGGGSGSGGGGSSGGGSGGARGRGGGTGSHQATDRAARENSWSDEGSSVTVHPFSMDVGPTIQLGDDPTDIFLRFFTPQLLDHIVTETNLFACQCLSSAHEGEGPPPTWETNTEEIKAYLGFAILMGINRLPDLYDYWSTDEVFHYYPIASRIPRKRFLEIARFLHFANNENFIPRAEPGHDRLAKVRPVIEFVRRSFLGNYNPHCENSIDEAMIRFKGRSTLKQYMPKKTIKRGFKVWVRADSHNGYICDVDVYTGKEDSVETALGSKVVKKLSQQLVGGNYHLYFDNYFTSIPLLEDLLEDGLYACGTIRRDRKGVPDAIKNTKLGKFHNGLYEYIIHCRFFYTGELQRGEYRFRQRGNLVATTWRDRKLVYVMSTNPSPSDITVVKRRAKDGSVDDVTCPESISRYNRFMGGVDLSDQMRGYYPVRAKCRKYYK